MYQKTTNHPNKIMPETARFLGIIIAMYHDEHNPPHFHVRYNEFMALMRIDNLNILSGESARVSRGMGGAAPR